MISTGFMMKAGLNQWNPMKRARRDTALFRSPTENPDVFVAKIALFLTVASSSLNTLLFRSRFSGTASMIRSQSARSPTFCVNEKRAIVAP